MPAHCTLRLNEPCDKAPTDALLIVEDGRVVFVALRCKDHPIDGAVQVAGLVPPIGDMFIARDLQPVAV